MRKVRIVTYGMQIVLVYVDRIADSHPTSVLELLGGVVVIVGRWLHVMGHVFWMVVGHRHDRYVTMVVSRTESHNRVSRSSSVSRVTRLREK